MKINKEVKLKNLDNITTYLDSLINGSQSI